MILINQNPINLSHTYLTTVHGSIQVKNGFCSKPVDYGTAGVWPHAMETFFFFRTSISCWLLAIGWNEKRTPWSSFARSDFLGMIDVIKQISQIRPAPTSHCNKLKRVYRRQLFFLYDSFVKYRSSCIMLNLEKAESQEPLNLPVDLKPPQTKSTLFRHERGWHPLVQQTGLTCDATNSFRPSKRINQRSP